MKYNHFSYCEDIASRLKAIGHSATETHFFRATEQTEVQELENNMISAKGFIMIAVDGKNVDFGWKPDSLIEFPLYSILIVGQVSSSDSDTIFKAQDDCSELAIQVIAKMAQDAEAYNLGAEYIDQETFTLNGFGPIGDLFYGVSLSFIVREGVNFQINKSFWID
jgi:hypothetical protein